MSSLLLDGRWHSLQEQKIAMKGRGGLRAEIRSDGFLRRSG